MVILLKPIVPLCPVSEKDMMVAEADWFVAILTSLICELVIFPLMVKLTVEPLLSVASTFVAKGLGDGVITITGVGVNVGRVNPTGEVGAGVIKGLGTGVGVVLE
jgi:hypothetical protein